MNTFRFGLMAGIAALCAWPALAQEQMPPPAPDGSVEKPKAADQAPIPPQESAGQPAGPKPAADPASPDGSRDTTKAPPPEKPRPM